MKILDPILIFRNCKEIQVFKNKIFYSANSYELQIHISKKEFSFLLVYTRKIPFIYKFILYPLNKLVGTFWHGYISLLNVELMKYRLSYAFTVPANYMHFRMLLQTTFRLS